jgi:hypothetical protein
LKQRCAFCGDAVEHGMRFCCDECAAAESALKSAIPQTPTAGCREHKPSSACHDSLFDTQVASVTSAFASLASPSFRLVGMSADVPFSGFFSPDSSVSARARWPGGRVGDADVSRLAAFTHAPTFSSSVSSSAATPQPSALGATASASGRAGFDATAVTSMYGEDALAPLGVTSGRATLAAMTAPMRSTSGGVGAGGAADGGAGAGVEPLDEPSLCIPWVEPEVGRDFVATTFDRLGIVRQVDLVPREDHFLCFVHFYSWRTDDPEVDSMRVSSDPFHVTLPPPTPTPAPVPAPAAPPAAVPPAAQTVRPPAPACANGPAPPSPSPSLPPCSLLLRPAAVPVLLLRERC